MSKKISVLLALILVVTFVPSWNAIYLRNDNRHALIELFQASGIGNAYVSCAPKCSGAYHRSLLWEWVKPKYARIREPELYFGDTGGWVAHFVMTSGVVSGKAIRVVDGNHRPCDAPPDEGDVGNLRVDRCF